MSRNREGSDAAPSRRDFLRLAAAAGLAGPFALGCRGPGPREEDAARGPPPEGAAPGPDHLALGLVAMGVAHGGGWPSGHHGAAVLAGHFFCRDNGLGARAERALRAQLDAYVARRPAEFPGPDPGPGSADPALIAERLDRQIPMLRSGGHDAIFASLALRALRERPDLASPAVVDGVCRLLDAFAATARPARPSRHHLEHPLRPYADADDLASVTLRATLRPWGHVMQVGASGVLHWVTHAEALVTLEELGHGEVARRGHDAHRLHINRPVEAGGAPEPDRAPVDWLGPDYWESDAPRRPLDGTWLFGHSFKLPYSLFRLLRRVDDPDLRRAALARAARLSIPFDRGA